MATPTDPTFGSDFDADLFRQAITSTMEMGLPSDTSERITFVWNPVRDYNIEDTAGNPYDWTSTPTSEEDHPEVQIPAAIQISTRGSLFDGTSMGVFNQQKLTVTILDTYYDQVKDADYMRFDDADYDINFWEPPMGLFDVTIYTIHGTARDEA